jgi:hypothetical protein
MRLIRPSTLALAVALCGLCAAQGHEGTEHTQATQTVQRVTQDSFDSTIAGWMEMPREVARKMVAKYGLPDAMTPDMMVWKNNGPWKMSVLENVMIPHNFPYPHHDMLYQTIDHRVSEGWFDELARFDGSLIAERTRGTLGARCDYEEANFLAINLAHDIMTNKRSVGEAREFYASAASAMKSGSTTSEQSRYLNGFIFDVTESSQGDPDAEWDGTYSEEYEYMARQEPTYTADDEMETAYDRRSNKFVARMTGLPGRPNWDHRMKHEEWFIESGW